MLKAATFEGMSPANLVSGRLIEFHRRMAGGGTAMTTVSYIAVSRDGMGAPSEIYIHDAAAEGLARIAAAVHAEGARISAQLGHAGAVGTIRRRYLGPSAARTIAGTEVHLGHRDRRMASGSATAGACIHCNKCVPSICTGTRCVLDQPDPGAGIVAVT